MSSEQKTKQTPNDKPAPKVRDVKTRGGKDNWYLKKKDSKKLDQWKEMKRSNKKYKPQLGVELYGDIMDTFNELSKFAGVALPEATLRNIEGIVALYINLRHCERIDHFTSGIFLYVRDMCSTSMSSQVINYVRDLFADDELTAQSSVTPTKKEPNWLIVLRDMQTNWTLVKNNRVFKHFSKLLGILVTLGLCQASDLEFSIHGFKLFDQEMLSKHMTAYDLADALFGTVSYFAEGAYLCFQKKSFQPLLLNDFSVLDLDEEYTNIICWWDLVRNGNLERITGISDAEFSNRLNDLLNKLSALALTLKGLDKKLVNDKVDKCKKIKNDLVLHKVSSGTRRSPFAIELFGESNQGKTTFGDQMIDALLTSAALPTDKSYRAALNPGDKFYSNWTSDKLVAILDDMANEKSQFVEKPPTRAIIDICNNQMYYAPKAELEAKGKCFVEPEVVLVTTNVKNLAAEQFSNCPYSVQRRMDLIMTVKCKPEFQRVSDGKVCGVDSTKVRERYTIDGVYTPPNIDDIWMITIEKAVQPERITSVANYKPIEWRGKQMIDVSAIEAIQCAIEHFHSHRTNQFALMDGMRARSTCLEKCSTKGCCHLRGMCPDHAPVYDKQIGLPTAVALNSIYRRVSNRFRNDAESFGERCERATTKMLYTHATTFLDKWDWMCVIPSKYLEDERVVEFLLWYYKDKIVEETANMTWTLLAGCFLVTLYHFWFGILVTMCAYVGGHVYTKSKTKEILVSELRKRNNNLPDIVKNTRDKYASGLCKLSLSLAGLYMIAKIYSCWRTIKYRQSGTTATEPAVKENEVTLSPTTKEEIETRDAKPDVWAAVTKRSLPVQEASKTSTIERLKESVQRNLLHLVFPGMGDNGENAMANGLMIDSNLMLLPSHYFENDDELEVICHKVNANAIGGKFRTRLCRSSSYHIPNTDLILCFTSTGGSFKNILKFFPTGDLVDHPFQLLWRFKSGDMLTGKGYGKSTRTTNGVCIFNGTEYSKLSVNTFRGMCGAVVISDTVAPVITGVHVGGVEGTQEGCSCTATLEQLEDAIRHIRTAEGVLKTGSGNNFTKQILGKNILTDVPLHPKSPLNHLPENSQFEYYGSCPGATTSRSDVRRTPISDLVAEVTGVENIWGAPRMKPEWFGWQTALANASSPAVPVPHDLLEISVKDYKEPLVELASQEIWQSKPLTDKETLRGIHGKKFIDSINLSTSIGYPLSGAKRKYIIENEPTEAEPNNIEFTKEINDEIDRIHTIYKKGERAYTIAKACKKDEVLPKAKGKCRIFYGNSLPLTFMVRKYFLPVLRFLQMNPLLSECAVGINCHGPEWDQLMDHIRKYGEERTFGGDYGKYDQKLPSQLLIASLRIMIDISEAMGYSKEDRDIMEAMSGDIVYSLIAVNGDLIGVTEGMHISGNSLTVALNGISGSLNLRNFFYTQYSEEVKFRDAAAMVTYGDDNIGTVSEKYPLFNIKACSEFLAQYGQVYTMPDKESELRPYLDEGEFEFLKRTSVHHPALDVELGALANKSIIKSLHCYMRPKGAPLTCEEACALNIDTAIREWFNHGEEVYEMRRAQMQEIADRAGISHMCTMLDDDYATGVANWKAKYTNEVIVLSQGPIDFNTGFATE